MDPFTFAPIALLLDAVYRLVEGIASLVLPFAGSLAAALAVIVLTLLVRAALIPVGISQVKAEWARRRLAPKLQALQKKYRKNPELLQRKTMALYKAENVSPFAGFLPLLLQAPVVSLVYALFVHTSINGHANVLLDETVGGVSLGTSFVTVVAEGVWPGGLVFVGLFVVIAAVAWVSRRVALRLALPTSPDAAPAAATLGRVLSWLPFITVLFAAVVPLAATLYLTTTTVWTLVERALLRRRYWGESGGTAAVLA